MWQRFTEHARRIILLGQEEAGKLNSNHVGTEHLLLGLARQSDGSGARVLEKLGLTLEQVRAATLAAVPAAAAPLSSGGPKLTPKAKHVLELAAAEARRMRHNYIGTEHMLLALLREKDGIACAVLRGLGLELDKTRAQVKDYLEEKKATPATSQRPQDVAGVAPTPIAAQFRVAPAVRDLLDLAAQESREIGASQIEIVHLLRALCRDENGSARVLREAGVDVAALRALGRVKSR